MKDRRQEHRRRLLQAAYDLAAEVGISGLRTRDIAERAGVNIATLHYCFDGKEALLQALYEYIREQFRADAQYLTGGHLTADERVAAEAEMRIRFARDEPKSIRVWRTFVGEAWVNTFIRDIVRRHLAEQRDRLAATVSDAAEHGGLRNLPNVKPRVAASLMIAIFDGLLTQSAMDPDAFDLEDYCDAMYGLLGVSRESAGNSPVLPADASQMSPAVEPQSEGEVARDSTLQ